MIQRRLFDSAGVRIGEGGTTVGAQVDERGLVIEFPLTPARVEIAGGVHLADPTIVWVHRAGSPLVDRAVWFALSQDALSGIMSIRDLARFDTSRALPLEASVYLEQLRFVERLRVPGPVDPRAVVRAVRGIVAAIVNTPAQPERAPAKPFSPRQRDLATGAKMLVADRAPARVSVRAIAARLGCSVFYLCHTFRDVERTTIGAYHTQIRLRAGARRLLEAPSVDLSDLALELGFSSHSHFTAAFRKAFGLTPSALVHASKRIAC